ncbi:hypothetical protein [Fischerella sp. PCC 9605]|uniref:hypothetical protein n=1 Tax=Fischerella sp. PCC 9605 TaxID=1173024 RepID=UPI00047AED25|nr:hypothetical protein [Fischerella sp. PCC 9605]
MKVIEFAKNYGITVNQAKKTVKIVLGVDVSKDRTLSPDELAALEAALRDAQLSGEQQHKALPQSSVHFFQNGVQPSEPKAPELVVEQSFQSDVHGNDDGLESDVQTGQNGVHCYNSSTAESVVGQAVQADVQTGQNGVHPSNSKTPESVVGQAVQADVQPASDLDNNVQSDVQTGQNGVHSSNSKTAEPVAGQSVQSNVQGADDLDNLDGNLDGVSNSSSQNVQTCPTENALTVSVPKDAVSRIEQLGSAEKDLKTGTVQLKTEISKAQGRGAGVATGLAFMQGLLEGEQEVLDVFTEESLQVFDKLQVTIDQQITDISQGTNDLLGKISSQRASNQERLQAIRSRVTKMIHRD